MPRISTEYFRRIRRLDLVNRDLMEEVATVLEKGLIDATQEELYKRTPLKVTHAMLKSIGSRIVGNRVDVGYNLSGVSVIGFGDPTAEAPYAKYRVNMKGVSKLGGHLLDMSPSKWIRSHVDYKIRAIVAYYHKKAMGNGVVSVQ